MVVTTNTDTMYAGNKRTVGYTIVDQDNADIALDITNLDLRWTLSEYADAGETIPKPKFVLEKRSTQAGQITKTDAVNGLADVSLVGIDTVGLVGNYHEQMEVVDAGGESVVVATGKRTIRVNVENT